MAKKEKEPKMSNKAVGKMSALKGLHRMASDMMGSDVAKMKQVSVMAKDKNGLKKGLSKAQALVGDDDSDDSAC